MTTHALPEILEPMRPLVMFHLFGAMVALLVDGLAAETMAWAQDTPPAGPAIVAPPLVAPLAPYQPGNTDVQVSPPMPTPASSLGGARPPPAPPYPAPSNMQWVLVL